MRQWGNPDKLIIEATQRPQPVDRETCTETEKGNNRREEETAFDTAKLQNQETKQQFTSALKNSFGILQEETEMTIHNFNMATELAGKAVLGYRRAKKEQWISTST